MLKSLTEVIRGWIIVVMRFIVIRFVYQWVMDICVDENKVAAATLSFYLVLSLNLMSR